MNRIRTALRVRRPLALFFLLYISAVFLLLQFMPTEPEPTGFVDGERTEITGRIIRKDIRRNDDGTGTLICTVDTEGDHALRIQCYMSQDDGAGPEPPVGSSVAVKGKIRLFQHATNPGEFDSAVYYQINGLSCRMTGAEITAAGGDGDAFREALYRIRRRLSDSLYACMDEKDAGIMCAMLLGNRSGMDDEVKELYQRSGIIHILAISGLHISIIGMGLFRLLRKAGIPGAAAMPVCVAVMLSYGEMCGMSSSAARAVIMFVLHLLAMVTGKSYDILTALSLAAFLLVLEQPLYLEYSGFLFSFLAILAIGVFLPAVTPDALMSYAPRRNAGFIADKAEKLVSGLLSSAAVSMVTLPVYMIYYHTFPVYSCFINILILPLMGVVMGAGILCMLIGTVSVLAGTAAGMADHLFLRLFEVLCLAENSLPGATWVTGHASGMRVAVYYICLSLFALFIYLRRDNELNSRKKKKRDWRYTAAETAAKAVFLAAAVFMLSFRTREGLKITVLDVGQGDGIVIEAGDRTILLDGGSSSRSELGKYVLLPFLTYEGISHVDAAVVSHEDDDHINGLMEMIEGSRTCPVRIDMLILPDIAAGSKGDNYRKLVAAAEKADIDIAYAARGDEILKGDVRIRCLGPARKMSTAEANEYSTILWLECGQFTALFTGDEEGAGEESLMEYLASEPDIARDVTLLKVAHHGSRYTTCAAFLDRVDPKLCAISCGRDNSYGHPHAELMERLERAGALTDVTARSGALTYRTDGRSLSVERYIGEQDVEKR